MTTPPRAGRVVQATAPGKRADLPEHEIQSIGAPTESSIGKSQFYMLWSDALTCWQGLVQVNVFVMVWRAWYFVLLEPVRSFQVELECDIVL